jgi:hypothetical protein
MELDLARQQWQDGSRRVERVHADRDRYARLTGQVDLLVAALRKRVGQVFTLDELAQSYEGADEWARTLLDDAEPEAAVTAEPGTLADAAFHAYARGASDYRP